MNKRLKKVYGTPFLRCDQSMIILDTFLRILPAKIGGMHKQLRDRFDILQSWNHSAEKYLKILQSNQYPCPLNASLEKNAQN